MPLALYQSRRNEGVEGYFLANRRMPWWAIGLSVMATQASAITFIGTTGQAFDDGMEFVQFYLALPFAMVVLCAVFVPFFYRARVFTAYEYLEQRFDPKTRSLAGFLFLLSRGMGAGIILYAPAIVLSVILGWDERVTILVIAVIFAAAMSSLDSEITALSSATIIDFYKRWFRPEATEGHYLLVSRLATLGWGVFASGVALYAGQLGSLIEAVNQVGSFFYGSLLGVFLLAFFVPRARGTQAFVGLLAGMLSVFLVSLTTDISWLYYNVVGAGVVVLVGGLSGNGRGGLSVTPDSNRA